MKWTRSCCYCRHKFDIDNNGSFFKGSGASTFFSFGGRIDKTRDEVRRVYFKHNCDIVNAIMELSD